GIFVSVAQQYKALQVMGRKTADCAVNSAFDVCAALINGSARCAARNLDFFQLVELLKHRRVCTEGDESRVVRMAGVIRLLYPLNGRLDRLGRHALRNIEKIDNGYE